MNILDERENYALCFGNGLSELLSLYPTTASEPGQKMSKVQKTVDNGNRDQVYAGIYNRADIMFKTS